ncbi:MAG: ATP-binding protein [Aquabacterium sp.]
MKLLLGGAVIMSLIAITDYRNGLSTPLDLVMLPALAVVTLISAWVVARSQRFMKPILAVNGLLFALYYEGLFLQSVMSTDMVGAYSLASTAQFLPGLYIALFVVLSKRAAQVCWLIYATLAVQCIYGLVMNPDTGPFTAMKTQLFVAILTAQPCCILVLTFMNHLRRMIEEARNESLAAKERFLAVVSHEVRSPLQTIVSSLELVEETTPRPIMERAVRRIRSAASMLEAQIRDLTAFTRLELTNDLQLETVDLAELASLAQQTHGEAAARKGLTWRTDLPAHPLIVKADGARLRQIIDNLAGNAIKYTAAGEITLGCRLTPEGACRFWMADTGRGIPPDMLHKVFEPFVRVKGSPQERIEGSGLGLAVVRQLVGLMRGRILVDSVVGQGTCVAIELPLPVVCAPAEGDAQPPPASVLVIDDDDSILQSICDLLRQWGVADIVTAADGRQAQEALDARRFDVALIDLQLPYLNGYEVARSARTSLYNAKSALVAMSAVQLDRRQANAGCFDSYLAKPVSRATLMQTVSQVHQARQMRAA